MEWLHGNDIYWEPCLQRSLICADYYFTGYRIVNKSPSQTKNDIKFTFEIYKHEKAHIEIVQAGSRISEPKALPTIGDNAEKDTNTETLKKIIYISPGDNETKVAIVNSRSKGWNRILAQRKKGVDVDESVELALILWTFHCPSGIKKPEQLTINAKPYGSVAEYNVAMAYKKMFWPLYWTVFGIAICILVTALVIIYRTYRKHVRLSDEGKFEPELIVRPYK